MVVGARAREGVAGAGWAGQRPYDGVGTAEVELELGARSPRLKAVVGGERARDAAARAGERARDAGQCPSAAGGA